MYMVQNLWRRMTGSDARQPSRVAGATAAETSSCITQTMHAQTREIHKQTERSPFTEKLRKGTLPEECYVRQLTDQYAVYSTLEEAMRKKYYIPGMSQVYVESLCRAPYLAKDIQSFAQPEYPLSDAAKAYVAHLKKLASHQPNLLLAHAYVLYGGNLSGGFVIKKWVEKIFPGKAEFYNFDKFINEDGQSKDGWKKNIDAMPLTAHERALMSEEAAQAFRFVGEMMRAALQHEEISDIEMAS